MLPGRLKLFAVSISEGIRRLSNGCPPSSRHRFGRSPGGSVRRGRPIGVPCCPNKEIRLILSVASGVGDAGRTGEMHLPGGRLYIRFKSCGLTRKRNRVGKRIRVLGSGNRWGLIPAIGMLLYRQEKIMTAGERTQL